LRAAATASSRHSVQAEGKCSRIRAALFGASGYATLMGRLAMPSLLAQAAAPWIGALLLERIGAHGTMAVVASVAANNVALTVWLGWMVARHRQTAFAKVLIPSN